MIPHLLHVGVILSLSKPSISASNANSSSYIGAVVEYHPVTDGDDGQMIAEANANNYRTIIENASKANADIIVFPENGLTSLPNDGSGSKKFNETEYRAYYRDAASYMPSPDDSIVMCDTDNKYAKSLQSISCAAKEYKMYVVVNHFEWTNCTAGRPTCASDGFLIYNTNVVFDREGRLIARYRKYNVFNEPGINITAKPEISIFETDFGVTFGQFICFDLLHEAPAALLAANPAVTDIVFSSHWFDELPFITSLEIQAAWAYGANVNLLAAGYSEKTTGSTGSGIYGGRLGPLATYQSFESSNALVVAEVPRAGHGLRWSPAHPPHLHMFKQAEVPTVARSSKRDHETPTYIYKDDLSAYTSAPLEPERGSRIQTLCDRDLCCDFHIETEYDKELAAKPGVKHYRYRLVVMNGVRGFGNGVITAGIEVCALVSCTGDSLAECGKLYSKDTNVVAPTKFESLIVTRRADLTDRVLYAPTTLTRDLEPMNGTDFAYLSSGQKNSSLLLMYLVRPQRNVFTFGIYGRNFEKDGEEVTKPSSASVTFPLLGILLTSLLTWRLVAQLS